MNDADGKFTHSKIISLKIKATSNWNVKVLNNPVKSVLNIMVTDVTGKTTLSISDVTGKNVATSTTVSGAGQVDIPLSMLQPGLYIMVAQSNNERKAVKFIKQ
jgi:hypothetical protein